MLENEYSYHINNIVKKLDENDYDGMIVHNFNNIYYLTGYMPTSFAFLILSQNPKVYVAKMDIELAENNSYLDIIEFKSFNQLNTDLKSQNLKNFAIESDLPIDIYEKFKDFNLSIESYINDERVIKSDNEIKNITEALNIAHKSLIELNPREKQEKGLTEWELAYELGYLMRQNGAQKESFETIVASGANSSLPHALVSDKKLVSHILIDYGCKYNGYCSDTTRTYPNTEKEDEIFNIVLEAYNSALKTVKPGIKSSEIDDMARNVIKEYGYGDKFIHSTGHSLGLDIHESPNISYRDNTILEDNMIITIEPGIYLEGEFGVRIEDTVLVNGKGKVLGNLPLKL